MSVLPLLLAALLNAPQPDPAKPTIDFLLDSAASDFKAHAPKAIAFRKVYFGQYDEKGHPAQYEICGEFQVTNASGKKEWLHFVTIKTSGYEQYIAPKELSYCTREG